MLLEEDALAIDLHNLVVKIGFKLALPVLEPLLLLGQKLQLPQQFRLRDHAFLRALELAAELGDGLSLLGVEGLELPLQQPTLLLLVTFAALEPLTRRLSVEALEQLVFSVEELSLFLHLNLLSLLQSCIFMLDLRFTHLGFEIVEKGLLQAPKFALHGFGGFIL